MQIGGLAVFFLKKANMQSKQSKMLGDELKYIFEPW